MLSSVSILLRKADNMEKKTNRINVYLTVKDKKVLDEIKYKYHLSYSTIINIILNNMIVKRRTPTDDKLTYINEKYLHNKDGYKTSIKPKLEWYFLETAKLSIIYTNATLIFTRNEFELLGWKGKELQQIKSNIYNEFQNTYEENWDGNRFNRIMPRILKHNREYYKRILEDK